MSYFVLMKPLILLVSSIIIIAISVAAVASMNTPNENPAKHAEVVLRSIGHQLLLSAKDSSSRVLPVKQLNEHTYQVSFQKELGFVSDSLINLVQRTFAKSPLAKDYIVNLRSCDQNETVLAFEINGQTGDLTPCRGRKLEVGCYIIEIELLKQSTFNLYWLLLLILPVGGIGFYAKAKVRNNQETQAIVDASDFIQLGRFRFYAGNNVLTIDNNNVALSEKETKALKIFADNLNQVVKRETLMKEIWEDNGIVVISRNVDVLVSKLRKKLSDDSAVKLINEPGMGYKLMVG
jgi:hypothetical protein